MPHNDIDNANVDNDDNDDNDDAKSGVPSWHPHRLPLGALGFLMSGFADFERLKFST